MESNSVTPWKYGHYRVHSQYDIFSHVVSCEVDYPAYDSFRETLVQKKLVRAFDYTDSGLGYHVFTIKGEEAIQKLIDSGEEIENIDEFFKKTEQEMQLQR